MPNQHHHPQHKSYDTMAPTITTTTNENVQQQQQQQGEQHLSSKNTHAELKAKEFFAAGVGGTIESVVPLVHVGVADNNNTQKTSKKDHKSHHLRNNNNNRQQQQQQQSQEYQKILSQQEDNDDYDDDEIDTEFGSITTAGGGGGDDDDEEACGTIIPDRSICHLMGMNVFGFAYGLLIATFGLIILPTEAENFLPNNHAILLAFFLALCGISQLSGPVAGYFSDRCLHHPYGKRRPFLLTGAIVGIPSLYVLRYASMNGYITLYLVFFFLAMLALNVMYVAYSGALTDLINENQRGFANGLMGAFTVLGASIGFGCFSVFLTVQSGYYFYMLILGIAVFISWFAYAEDEPIRIISTTTSQQEQQQQQLDNKNQQQQQSYHLFTSDWTWSEIGEAYWVNPIEHSDFFLVFVSRTFYYMGVSVQTFMLFYFRDVIVGSIDPQADVAYLALFGQLTGAIVCVPMGMLSNIVGRKKLIYLSTGIIISTYIMFMVYRTRRMAFISGAIYGIGNGTYLSVDYALACDTLPSKDKAARYLGIWGVGAFIGTLLGPLFIGPTLLIFGHPQSSNSNDENNDGTNTPMYGIEGYIAILIIGCVCLLLGALTVVPIRSTK